MLLWSHFSFQVLVTVVYHMVFGQVRGNSTSNGKHRSLAKASWKQNWDKQMVNVTLDQLHRTDTVEEPQRTLCCPPLALGSDADLT